MSITAEPDLIAEEAGIEPAPAAPALAVPASAEPPRRGVLRNRDFRLLWAGETTSKFGSAITGVALPLVAVTVLDAGPLGMGVLTALSWVPWLVFGLPAGAWVDRWPRRTVMITCNASALVLLVSVPIVYWLGLLSMGYLLFVALASGIGAVFFSPAYGAYLPSLVDGEDLGEANAKLHGSAQVAFMGGSGVGGVIAAVFGAVGGILVDAITYLVAVVCLGSIRHREPRQVRSADAPRKTIRQDIADGIRFLVRDPYLRIIALCAGVENLLLSGALALLVVFLIKVVAIPAGFVGALLIADSLGGLAGALIANRVSRKLGTARALIVLAITTAPFGLLIPLTTDGFGMLFFAVGMGVPAAGMVACGIISGTFRMRYCPPQMQGRVSTSAMVIVYGSMPIGALIGGLLGSTLGITTGLWIMLGALAAAKWLRLIGPIKRSRDLPTEPAAAVPA
ncbi:MFS family permease [Allocatelliglobosispora scoriae]|uniref:MFS family permease n=1 Tax=Allocatelliglobosispora scoriae TaxID=643052 RepID=A0A841BYI0_9ACTN|nr:MFS transporter [Allocatelliglobosispora scoriae]MBB5872725.1 MFS family permease [Allocatelliglobosispora scoriae]